ncbi:DUF5994 family protein [Rhodococcus erythropolis]|uniref:DUF5994 family protein n=1 Tax=Rhodococcus erythropolis TaxID=1833 RepID=UPI0037A3D0ED
MTHETTAETRAGVEAQQIPRLRLKPDHLSGTAVPIGSVDGAWWPHSADLASQLPELLTVLITHLGPIDRVVYELNGLDSHPTYLTFAGRSVRLDGYKFQPHGTVYVTGLGGKRLVILVIPPHCDAEAAHRALTIASEAGNESFVGELLSIAAPSITP